MISKCKLCQRACDVQNSHIIPKFVGKWLKETSATGYFMTFDVDGQAKRSQDIEKKPLLCKKCESILNDFETYFANNIFYPFKKGMLKSIPINEKISKFAVSVSLRVLWVLRENQDSLAFKWEKELLQLEKEWREYIIDFPGFVKGNNSHHIMLSSKESLATGLSENPNLILNLMRVSTFYIYEKFKKAYLFSNMAGVQIISMINLPALPLSQGTQVYPEQTFGKVRPEGIGWGGYYQNLINFNRDCNVMRSKVKKEYNTMIVNTMIKNIDKTRNSEDIKLIAEQELFLKNGRLKK